MISKSILIKIIVVIIIFGFGINIIINLPSNAKEKRLFPGILGDAVLKNNEIGKQVIINMTSYDDFRGNIIQGYRATYSGINGTTIVFVAQMQDNISANISFKDMVVRNGYSENVEHDQNDSTIIKLPVENPEVFAMRKNDNMTWHYTFTKLDKVYWIGFSGKNIEYQAGMLIEAYRTIDNDKSSFNI